MQTVVLALLVTGCAGAAVAPPPQVAPFEGVETSEWLVEETEPIQREDLLPAFEASARDYGCSTEKLGKESTTRTYFRVQSYYGVSASCREGTIALVTLQGGRVRIGCTKPTTRDACDRLLRNIAEGR